MQPPKTMAVHRVPGSQTSRRSAVAGEPSVPILKRFPDGSA